MSARNLITISVKQPDQWSRTYLNRCFVQRLVDLMAATQKVLMVATGIMRIATRMVITLGFDTVFMTGYTDGHTRTARTLGVSTQATTKDTRGEKIKWCLCRENEAVSIRTGKVNAPWEVAPRGLLPSIEERRDVVQWSVADRRKIHAASMLYHIQNGSVPKLAGTSNWPFTIFWTNSTPGHDAPSVEEALEAEHWTHAAFYPPVILFDNIV
jgi:hypothetical protein